DGAGRGKTFYYVVLPMIAPTAGIIAILCTLNSLKVFDIVQTMTGGGPYYATDVIGTFVYRTAFSSTIGMPRIGYASAATILFGVVVIVMGLVLNWVKSFLQKKRG
ncbi:MAG: carbohydrate ABC transporter permease, partial [Hungatella hathewayi]